MFCQLLHTGTQAELHRTSEFHHTEENMRFTKSSKAISILAVTAFLVAGADAQTSKGQSCLPIGGMLMTNLGAIDANTTMGPATGDLKGSVGATILSTKALGKKLVFHVQHHWVTESGDTLSFDPATATTISVASGLYAVVTYPVHLTGGTGKFAGVTGDFSNIGEVDLNSGQLVLRYSGQICFSKSN
jgi:hypothetical protein